MQRTLLLLYQKVVVPDTTETEETTYFKYPVNTVHANDSRGTKILGKRLIRKTTKLINNSNECTRCTKNLVISIECITEFYVSYH